MCTQGFKNQTLNGISSTLCLLQTLIPLSFGFLSMLSCFSKPIYLFILCLGAPPLFWGPLFWGVCMCVYTDVNVSLMFFLRSVSLWGRGWALQWRFLFTWCPSAGAAGLDLPSRLWLGLEASASGAFTALPSRLVLGQSLPAVTCLARKSRRNRHRGVTGDATKCRASKANTHFLWMGSLSFFKCLPSSHLQNWDQPWLTGPDSYMVAKACFLYSTPPAISRF